MGCEIVRVYKDHGISGTRGGYSQLRRRCKGRFEVGFGARVEYMKPQAECIGYGLQVFRNRRSVHSLRNVGA